METLINPASKCEESEGFEAVNGEEDRLSDLSDHVLHHIFSFINPKYSVQASVLGKRWRHFWRSLPNLNFQSDNPPQNSFLGFLNQMKPVLVMSIHGLPLR
ncbi:hypothetical protein Scep_013297 [Stephania cephalantha]|uniref:F-box domain-containing protein n=1 Tax=Stephania cephalantha TaxID=152367 RepID=A0AAP0JGV3_9MAGN